MLKKIAETSRKPSKIDNHNPDFDKYRHSLNGSKRQRELNKIAQENYVRDFSPCHRNRL